MVLLTGLEPVTPDLEGRYSVLLSYRSFYLIWYAWLDSNQWPRFYENPALKPLSYKRFICYFASCVSQLTSHSWSSSILCCCRFHRAEKSFSFIWLTMIVFAALAFGLLSSASWMCWGICISILFICLKRIVYLRGRTQLRPLGY